MSEECGERMRRRVDSPRCANSKDTQKNKEANGEQLSDILVPRNSVLVHMFWFICQVHEKYRGAFVM